MIKGLFARKIKIKNSRRFKRIRVAYLVKYQINGKGEPRITNARDISAGGLRFWTTDQVPETALLHISILLPPINRAVKAVAKVLRIRRTKEGFIHYVAVSFLDLQQEDRQALSDFAETVSKDKSVRFMVDHADVVIRKR